MVTWTIPAVMILHKELVPLREDRFVVTYEYSWCKSTEDNGLGRREWSQAGTDVDIVDSGAQFGLSNMWKHGKTKWMLKLPQKNS